MQVEKPRLIVFFSVINFSFYWQRPQQITVRLAEKGFKIIYVHPSIGLFNGIIKTLAAIKNILVNPAMLNPSLSFGLTKVQRDHLYLVDFPIPVPRRGRVLSRILGILIPFLIFLIRLLIKKVGNLQSVIFYVCNPRVGQLFSNRLLKAVVRVYDCMDDWYYLSGEKDKKIIKDEEEIVKTSDLILATHEILLEKCKRLNSNAFLVPNAADIKHFKYLQKEKADTPIDISVIQHPILGYVGHLGYVDFKLIKYLANRHPEWNIALIGSANHLKIRKSRYNNLYFLGDKEYSDLPSYVNLFDVCIVPFLLNEATLHADPIKVYEYLASGKPVVATDLPALNKTGNIVGIGRNYFEFEQQIIGALCSNNSTNATARREFAEQNSWERRIEAILERLDQTYESNRVRAR